MGLRMISNPCCIAISPLLLIWCKRFLQTTCGVRVRLGRVHWLLSNQVVDILTNGQPNVRFTNATSDNTNQRYSPNKVDCPNRCKLRRCLMVLKKPSIAHRCRPSRTPIDPGIRISRDHKAQFSFALAAFEPKPRNCQRRRYCPLNALVFLACHCDTVV